MKNHICFPNLVLDLSFTDGGSERRVPWLLRRIPQSSQAHPINLLRLLPGEEQKDNKS